MPDISKRPSKKLKLQSLRSVPKRGTSSLRESLNRLYSRNSQIKHFPDDSFTRARRGMHEFVEGEYVNTSFGDIFVGKVRYPRDHVHGNRALLSIRDISDDWLSRWGKFSQRRKFDVSKTIFVDTETSGLAGAGGTIAFLIGIGYFYRNRFQIEQFFVDSHSREEGMLDLVADFVQPFDTLVTFNGKAFDIPLLETRYLLKRKQSPFNRMEHLDLLHPCRQLWNLTLDNCKLQTIEKEILHFYREDDLPGDEIPYAYFRYIRIGDPDPLYRVFQQNADDIATLAIVTYLLWYQTQGGDEHEDPTIEFSKGKIFDRYGENEKAIASLERALKKEASIQRQMTIKSQLSMIYKSRGDWRTAESLWLTMLGNSLPFLLLPYVELAKYYEHKLKDYFKAKEVVEMALSRISPHRVREISELQYRLARLMRKIEKNGR